jgi:hypothetical protein
LDEPVGHRPDEVLPLHAIREDPGAGEVVLHHGDVARGGVLLEVGLALVHILELDLLELLFFAEDRGAGKCRVEGRGAWKVLPVTHDLQIQLRRHRGRAGVDHFVPDGQVIGAAVQRVGLDQLDAILLGRFELQHQVIGAVLQRAVAAEGHHRLVVREIAADQA